MPESNTQTREHILAEVLLEIRFSGAEDVSLIVGKMHDALHETYPTFENLKIPDFPEGIPNFDTLVRYRIFSQDRSRLYNLGKGVLSINTVKYSHYNTFINNAKIVLKKHKEISKVTSISRIGLRYINKIPLQGRLFESLFRLNFSIPDTLKNIQTGYSFQTMGKIGNDMLLTKFSTERPYSKDAVILDFDYYTEQNASYDLDLIERWTTNAKDIIFTNFKNILTDTFYQSIR